MKCLAIIIIATATASASPELDMRAGVVSNTTHDSYNDYDAGNGVGPMLEVDGGIRLAPWLSLVGFASLATFTDRDLSDEAGPMSAVRIVLATAGPGVRAHWRNAFVGVGGGIAELHATFDAGDAPNGWANGTCVRLELGVRSNTTWGGVAHPELAAQLVVSWFGDAPPQYAGDQLHAELVGIELTAGVAF